MGFNRKDFFIDVCIDVSQSHYSLISIKKKLGTPWADMPIVTTQTLLNFNFFNFRNDSWKPLPTTSVCVSFPLNNLATFPFVLYLLHITKHHHLLHWIVFLKCQQLQWAQSPPKKRKKKTVNHYQPIQVTLDEVSVKEPMPAGFLGKDFQLILHYNVSPPSTVFAHIVTDSTASVVSSCMCLCDVMHEKILLSH